MPKKAVEENPDVKDEEGSDAAVAAHEKGGDGGAGEEDEDKEEDGEGDEEEEVSEAEEDEEEGQINLSEQELLERLGLKLEEDLEAMQV